MLEQQSKVPQGRTTFFYGLLGVLILSFIAIGLAIYNTHMLKSIAKSHKISSLDTPTEQDELIASLLPSIVNAKNSHTSVVVKVSPSPTPKVSSTVKKQSTSKVVAKINTNTKLKSNSSASHAVVTPTSNTSKQVALPGVPGKITQAIPRCIAVKKGTKLSFIKERPGFVKNSTWLTFSDGVFLNEDWEVKLFNFKYLCTVPSNPSIRKQWNGVYKSIVGTTPLIYLDYVNGIFSKRFTYSVKDLKINAVETEDYGEDFNGYRLILLNGKMTGCGSGFSGYLLGVVGHTEGRQSADNPIYLYKLMPINELTTVSSVYTLPHYNIQYFLVTVGIWNNQCNANGCPVEPHFGAHRQRVYLVTSTKEGVPVYVSLGITSNKYRLHKEDNLLSIVLNDPNIKNNIKKTINCLLSN